MIRRSALAILVLLVAVAISSDATATNPSIGVNICDATGNCATVTGGSLNVNSAAGGSVTANQGTPAAAANAWPVKPTDSGGVNQQAIDPNGNAAIALARDSTGRSTALTGSLVLKASAGTLLSLTVDFTTAAFRALMLFDAATAPVDGAVTPFWCFNGISQTGDAANSFKSIDFTSHPLKFSTGITAVLSTNTAGCFSKTADGANDAFFPQIQ